MPGRKRNPQVVLYDGSTSNGEQQMSDVNSINNSSLSNGMENNNMNGNNSALSNLVSHLWENRVMFTPNVATACITMSEDEIKLASPVGIFTKLVMDGKIGITNVPNVSRAEGISVLFADPVQMDQMARALAYEENGVFKAWYEELSSGLRKIALLDTKGSQSRQVIEERGEDGYIGYQVRYANPAFNNHGDLIGLKPGAFNPVQESIYTRVEGYNSWVVAHNAAVMAKALGEELDADQVKALGKAVANEDPNKFVQYNTIHSINPATVVNKYAIAAWLALDDNRPAFHIYSPARTLEATVKFIEGRLNKMTWGYQSQLRVLAGIPYVKVDEEVTVSVE